VFIASLFSSISGASWQQFGLQQAAKPSRVAKPRQIPGSDHCLGLMENSWKPFLSHSKLLPRTLNKHRAGAPPLATEACCYWGCFGVPVLPLTRPPAGQDTHWSPIRDQENLGKWMCMLCVCVTYHTWASKVTLLAVDTADPQVLGGPGNLCT
jgi:hypothetical protein